MGGTYLWGGGLHMGSARTPCGRAILAGVLRAVAPGHPERVAAGSSRRPLVAVGGPWWQSVDEDLRLSEAVTSKLAGAGP